VAPFEGRRRAARQAKSEATLFAELSSKATHSRSFVDDRDGDGDGGRRRRRRKASPSSRISENGTKIR